MPTARTRKSLTIRQARQAVLAGDMDAETALRKLAIEALSMQERAVFDLLAGYARYDSAGIAVALGIKQNYAGTILKTLCDLRLISRQVESDSSGCRYVYWGE